MSDLDQARQRVRENYLADETATVRQLIELTGLSPADRAAISAEAKTLVTTVRTSADPGLMESFLAQYGLETEEGLALMSLAEALLRVPDSATIDMLISDKIGKSDWDSHLWGSKSPLVNFSTWALNITSDVLGAPKAGPLAPLQNAIRRLGEPVIRTAVSRAMQIMGNQFVFGRTIAEATKGARALERDGYRFSYDMLGEAARTAADAERYMAAYSEAIAALATRCTPGRVHNNPGISVKLSAIHPRYEFGKRERVMSELVPRLLQLARAAKAADMSFNIDAEEAERLDLSLDIIEAVLRYPTLAGWDGFGVVVQGYGKRVLPLIDWLSTLAKGLDRRIMVRLVKGAYWDAEIKRAQVLGLDGFPVFTRKASTDISYMAAARRLLEAEGAIYPQFATHNAHTAAAVLHIARQLGRPIDSFEFQRLHGMGEQLHKVLRKESGTRTRIYAPVGPHKDLLAYLVRRLLENGSSGSFVHQIADEGISPEKVAADPISSVLVLGDAIPNPAIKQPRDLYQPLRANAKGWDISDVVTIAQLEQARAPFRDHRWSARPMLAGYATTGEPAREVRNPADPSDIVGEVTDATLADVDTAVAAAAAALPAWSARPVAERSAMLRKLATLFEANAPEFFALLAREAGKVLADGVSELREAVDFLHYYAAEAERHADAPEGRGVFVCISPWNFPLAIFTGQIAAALVTGNTVLAKPAEQSPLIAARAVALMHEAGIPSDVIQLLPGTGSTIGSALTRDGRVAGVCFTGSLPTARRIERSVARHLRADAPLIAETGGINAMIVDSTALPEQAVRDVLASAFQSAGQRCSALRVLYVQEDAAERTIDMLKGAMGELSLGNSVLLSTDIGPVIDTAAQGKIAAHVEKFRGQGKVIAELAAPTSGTFVGPAVLEVDGIDDIPEEIFGPVLHVARFKASDIERVIDRVNATSYGLTFGLHTRMSSRVQTISETIRSGNIYINRNQIGAVVGSQPFGGEGLSGTGPKAGGPHYLARFRKADGQSETVVPEESLPGPTGESNTLKLYPRGLVLCLGPSPEDVALQAELAEDAGNTVLRLDGAVDPETLVTWHLDAVMYFGEDETAHAIREALSRREGILVPLIAHPSERLRLSVERHLCIDTTAAGGNASLLSQAAEGY